LQISTDSRKACTFIATHPEAEHQIQARQAAGKNMNTKNREQTSQLPAVRQETQLAFQEAKSMVRKAFVTAIKTNLAFLACSGMYAYRSGQRFWEQKGSSWWARTRAFSKTAYLAIQEDAFGSDIVIETLDMDRILEEGRPTLSIPPTPEAVDDLSARKSPKLQPGRHTIQAAQKWPAA
jgi:hypothetical protein